MLFLLRKLRTFIYFAWLICLTIKYEVTALCAHRSIHNPSMHTLRLPLEKTKSEEMLDDLRLQMLVMFSDEGNFIAAIFEWCAQASTAFYPLRSSARAPAGNTRNYLIALKPSCCSAFFDVFWHATQCLAFSMILDHRRHPWPNIAEQNICRPQLTAFREVPVSKKACCSVILFNDRCLTTW